MWHSILAGILSGGTAFQCVVKTLYGLTRQNLAYTTVKNQRIREDGSVFGQIYFDDTDTVMYDANEDADVPTHIKGKQLLWTRRFICFEILVHL